MKKCFFICLLFSFLGTSCLVQRSMDLGIETVLESKPPKLSSLLTNIRYVALETTDHSLLKEAQDVVLTDKYIVYSDAEQCYVFDKKTGKYLHKIGNRKDQGPQGYSRPTYPLCIMNNEVFMKDEKGNRYKTFSLDDGQFLRFLPGDEPEKYLWSFEKTFLLGESLIVHCPFNISGQNRNRMVISTLSGKPLKVYPSINNASVSLTRFFFDLYEVDFYKYKEDVFYHEFTSDTIFKINPQLELEPHYVLGLGEKLPTLTEIRNGDAISKDKNLVFGHIMETDRWLLLSKSAWTHFFYLYNKRTDQFMRCDYEKYKGFENDLDGFLPFWPSYQGIGKASHEICSIIEVEDFLDGIDTTGENPLSCRPDFDENPIVVIGTM